MRNDEFRVKIKFSLGKCILRIKKYLKKLVKSKVFVRKSYVGSDQFVTYKHFKFS